MAYLAMLRATGQIFRNDAVNVTPQEFKHGTALYCFDISKNGIDSETFELSENGSLSFVFKLHEELNHGVAAVIYLEHDGMHYLQPNNAFDLKN